METYKTMTEATAAAEQFFLENFGHTSGVGIESENENEVEFYSKEDPGMDDTFTCTVGMLYTIGAYKDGDHFAKEVSWPVRSLAEIKDEFKRMWEATKNDIACEAEPTLSPTNFKEAWRYRHFSEDVNHVGVFEKENARDVLSVR